MSALKQAIYGAIPLDTFVKTIINAVIENPFIDYNQVKQAILDNKNKFDDVPVVHLEDHKDLASVLVMLLHIENIKNVKLKALLKQAYLSSVTGRSLRLDSPRYKPGTLESDDECDLESQSSPSPPSGYTTGLIPGYVPGHHSSRSRHVVRCFDDDEPDYYHTHGHSQEKPY